MEKARKTERERERERQRNRKNLGRPEAIFAPPRFFRHNPLDQVGLLPAHLHTTQWVTELETESHGYPPYIREEKEALK